MSSKKFSSMEIDAIGEIMNISLGSSATAVSNMLDHRVDITTPQVKVVNAEEFTWEKLEPAIGVEIKYVTGLEGSNIMLLKERDVKAITDILLGMETPDEEFEMNELTLSAVCEVMNQMMGAASTALSDFLGRMVNISTPQTFDANDLELVKTKHLPVSVGPIVVIQFNLSIEGAMTSEFMNVISVELAKELVAGFGLEAEDDEEEEVAPEPQPSAAAPTPASPDGKLSQEEIERLMGMGGGMGGGVSSPEPAPAPQPAAPAASSGGKMSQEEIERLMSGMGGGMSSPEPAPAPQPAAPAASSGGKMSQEEIERLMSGMGGGMSAPAPQPAAPPSAAPQQAAPAASGGKMSQEEIEAMMAGAMGAPQAAPAPQAAAPQQAPPPQAAQAAVPGYGAPPGYWGVPPQMEQMQAQMQQMQQMMMMQMQQMQQMQAASSAAPEPKAKKADPKVIQTQGVSMPRLEDGTQLNEEQSQNLDLIMSVPLEVAVEIGRTRKKVQEILSLSKGSLVVLNKLAGDQVDVYVNGKCIAHGDVVVVDDNFGIRISEIVRKPGLDELRP